MDNIDQWHLQRKSKFTASENYKLLLGGKGTTVFGDGAMTYIRQKALEMSIVLWERPEMDGVQSLLHGKMYELPAFQAYQKATNNYSMTYLGEDNPLFLEYEPLSKESGGSPDAINLTNDAKIDKGAEIKCPKNPMVHFERLKWRTMWDVKEGYSQCYTQIQNLIMITGADSWDFISYDERQIRVDKKIKIIEILPDRKFQDNLDLRLRMAVKEKYRIYDEYMNS